MGRDCGVSSVIDPTPVDSLARLTEWYEREVKGEILIFALTAWGVLGDRRESLDDRYAAELDVTLLLQLALDVFRWTGPKYR